jgi:hypothetical protein
MILQNLRRSIVKMRDIEGTEQICSDTALSNNGSVYWFQNNRFHQGNVFQATLTIRWMPITRPDKLCERGHQMISLLSYWPASLC